MGIYISLLRIKIFFLCVVSIWFVAGCSPGLHITLRSTYAISEHTYTKLGYLTHNDPWRDIWPLITLDNGVSIKVHPASWYSFTFDETLCSEEFSEFYFSIWSQSITIFDVTNSYFISAEGTKVAVSRVSTH